MLLLGNQLLSSLYINIYGNGTGTTLISNYTTGIGIRPRNLVITMCVVLFRFKSTLFPSYVSWH